jgi:hypothetical protein
VRFAKALCQMTAATGSCAGTSAVDAQRLLRGSVIGAGPYVPGAGAGELTARTGHRQLSTGSPTPSVRVSPQPARHVPDAWRLTSTNHEAIINRQIVDDAAKASRGNDRVRTTGKRAYMFR